MPSKRRGNNEGSIYKRANGSWTGQVSVGHDLETGKRKRKSFYGQTRKEVADKIAKVLQELQNGSYIEPTAITLGEWLTKWLVNYKKGQLKPLTYESYENLIQSHIEPGLGKIPLAKLQAHTLQSFYNAKLANGRKDGKGGLSTRTVRYFHAIIREALEQATKEGLLSRNIADATNPPVIKNKPMHPLTESELLIFLESIKEDRLYAAYVVAAFTGLRRGELLGLCWDCVDLESGSITVKRSLIPLSSGLYLQESTKSKGGNRNIALTDDTLRELKAHKRRQAQDKLLMGKDYQNFNLCFCKEDGTYITPDTFTSDFKKRLAKAGLPQIRLHDLRHGHATLLLQRGIPAKLVQERLGHSSIQMTLDLYSHVTPEMSKAASESLNGLLSKEKPPAKAQGE